MFWCDSVCSRYRVVCVCMYDSIVMMLLVRPGVNAWWLLCVILVVVVVSASSMVCLVVLAYVLHICISVVVIGYMWYKPGVIMSVMAVFIGRRPCIIAVPRVHASSMEVGS